MRFATFLQGGTSRAGVVETDGAGRILDLAHPAVRPALDGIEPRLQALVEAGIERVVTRLTAATFPDACRLPMADVQLQAPFPAPKRIIAAALNYRDALVEREMPPLEEPKLFIKQTRTVIGPDEPVRLPAGIGGVTWEAEMAVVIGRAARDIAPSRALDHVAGYFVFNDVSASEVIRADGHFDRGKNFPTFGPSGPFFVTADDVPDPQDLAIRFTLNGEVMQDSSTSQMLFGVADLISRLSRADGLAAGDVIATGTPAGAGVMRKPPRWIKPGDVMVAEVERLGRLSNPVVSEEPHV